MATAVTGAVAGADAPARRRASFRRFIPRNPTLFAGGVILSLIALLAVAAPLAAGPPLVGGRAPSVRRGCGRGMPGAGDGLGTPNRGRDLFAPGVHGARVS